MRWLLAASIVAVAAGAAHADPDPCEPVPVSDATPRAMTLQLVDATPSELGSWTSTIAIAPGAQLPAISEDGKTLAILFEDSEDFSGIPVATLQLWSKQKVVASFQLTSVQQDPATAASQAALAAQVLADANARLAKTKWRPVPAAVSCPADDQHEVLGFAGGLRITYDLTSARLSTEVVATRAKDRRKPHRLAARFGAPGTMSLGAGAGEPGKGCGDVSGMTAGYGARSLGFVVLVPRESLPGDACIGNLGVDNAIVVPVP